MHGIKAIGGPLDGITLTRSGTEYAGCQWRHLDEETFAVSVYVYRFGRYEFSHQFQAVPSDVPASFNPLESLLGVGCGP